MYEFMSIAEEQHTALTLCLLLLSYLIACSLSAALCSRGCCIPGRQGCLSIEGCPSYPAAPGKAKGWKEGYHPSPAWQKLETRSLYSAAEVMSKSDRDGNKVEISLTHFAGTWWGWILPSPWSPAQLSPTCPLKELRAHSSLRWGIILAGFKWVLYFGIRFCASRSGLQAVTSTFIKPNFKPPRLYGEILPTSDHEERETRDFNVAKTNCQCMRNMHRKI